MNPTAATSSLPPSPAESGAAPASPPWADTYLRALSEHRQKALAAIAAGQELPAIVRQRHTDPSFAQREAEILEALADLLESEAIRRSLARGPIKKVGSDALLLRLLAIFHPRWTAHEKGILTRLAPNHCTPSRRSRGEFGFDTRRQRADFQKWEREQAVALALSTFYQGFENLPVTSYSLSSQYRDLTGESLGTIPKRTPAPWHRPNPNASTPATNLSETNATPASNFVAAAGFERSEPERSGDGRRQKDCPAIAGQPEGSERMRASTPQTAEPNSQALFEEPSPSSVAASGNSRAAAPNPQPNPGPVPSSLSAPGAKFPSSPSYSPASAPQFPTKPAFPKPAAHSTTPAAPPKPGLGRRLLWGLAMPPESKTGLKPYPGFISWLIKVGAIKSPTSAKPAGATSTTSTSRPSDSS